MNSLASAIENAGRGGAYRPNQLTARILNRALRHVQSVPYAVSLRWLEYQLLQDSTFKSKGDFLKFKSIVATARKRFWNGWTPSTLADDTRHTIERGNGDVSPESWAQAVADHGVQCRLDHWLEQERYVEIWFEAAAMAGQFEHHTDNITLRPFKGDASIPYKWTIAKALERAHARYDRKPITILYFGDLDAKGMQIPESAVRDIRAWSVAPFEFIRVGLNAEHPAEYDIPENPDRPGDYQWEALGDDAARELITSAIDKYVDTDLLQELDDREAAAEDQMRGHIAGIKWQEGEQP